MSTVPQGIFLIGSLSVDVVFAKLGGGLAFKLFEQFVKIVDRTDADLFGDESDREIRLDNQICRFIDSVRVQILGKRTARCFFERTAKMMNAHVGELRGFLYRNFVHIMIVDVDHDILELLEMTLIGLAVTEDFAFCRVLGTK
ncbi:hypothetical protein J2Z66_005938 [Paenibacillus eucommiae]|uniref:Uncharacterized protein n=1 Tax=Paenibacillus eucommiae TaxID=1355755 RepID=A0ABS4J394_9BACL|nr:hypothetical protein [Paenibacillus eucommiae]MBP1994302.1 hypothetical protein [Paenibacillus eucommiae]